MKPTNPPNREADHQATRVSARKQPRQERSRIMVDAILQAAAEVFADFGYAATTTNKIATRAGVSVGSLYQYFPNKDALLHELLKRHHADVDQVLATALTRLADPATALEDGMRQLVTDLVTLHRADPALSRALSTSVLIQSSAADHRESDDHHREQIAALLARPDVRAGSHGHMALVLGQTTAHLCRWLVHDAPPSVPAEDLLEEVVQVLVRYLAV